MNPNGAVEDLVNTLEELRPGMVRSRMVLEISTEDKLLAALLNKLAEDIPDEVNAPAKKPRQTKRGKAISLKGKATEFATTDEDGGEL